MTPLLIVGLVVVIGLMITWTRVGLHRSDKRSMESYGHALNVLGGVAARSDRPARIRVVGREDGSAPEGRPDTPAPADHDVISPRRFFRGPSEAVTADALVEPAESPGPLEPLEAPKVRLEDVPVEFEDDSDAFERAREEAESETLVAVPVAAAGVATAAEEPADGSSSGSDSSSGPAYGPHRGRRHGGPPKAPWTRIGSSAAGLLILAAIVLAAVDLSGGGAPRHHAAGPTTTVARSSSSSSTTVATPTTLPKVLQPVSATPTDVSFAAPSGSYAVTFADTTGTCWLGITQTSGGAYVWQDTLNAGQSTTYKATGPIVIRVGAPLYVKVTVNGIPAQLPGYSQPYDVSFNPATPPSSA